jgi:CheY-like chemotaxis protein
MLSEATKPTVLLVEDSEDDAFFFKWTFERSEISCSIHHVVDGAAAVDFLSEASRAGPGSLPRMIFLDLKMPVMNGFEVLSWLQEQTFAQLPVVVLSGSDQQSDKERARQLGAMDYLVKPIKVAHFQKYLAGTCPAVASAASEASKVQV